MMRDEKKTKDQLLEEVRALRQQVATLETAEAERKQAEEALRESEERYRQSVENSPNPIFSVNREETIQTWNRACEQVFQYRSEEILGQAYHKLLWNPEDYSAIEALLAQVWCGHSLSNQEMTYRSKGGAQQFTISRLYPLRDPHGNVQGCVFANTDITERKRTEETLRRRAEELAALQTTVLEITASHELPPLLQTVVERAARLLDALGGGMYLCDPIRGEVRCVVSYNTLHDYTGTTLKYGEGAAGTVAQTGEPLIIDDYRSWPGRAAAFEEKQPFTAVLAAPMIWENRVIGVIDLLRDMTHRGFTQAELELLTLFANHAAIAVENTRLYEHAQQEILERKKAIEALRTAEQEKAIILDSMSELVAYQDLEMNILWANRAASESVSVNPEQLVGHRCYEIWHQRHEPCEDCPVMKTRQTGQSQAAEITSPDGRVWFIRGYPVHDAEGDLIGIVEVTLDITERKRAEEALRESEERFRILAENVPGVIYLCKNDERWTMLFLNAAIEQLTGYPKETFLADRISFVDIYHPDDAAPIFAHVEESLAKHVPFHLVYRIKHRSGEWRWVDEVGVGIYHNGEVHMLEGFLTDITERKRAEEEVRKLNAELEERVQKRTAELEAANKELESFAYIVSHDLKAPLRGISHIAQWLVEDYPDVFDENGKKMIQLLVSRVKHMDNLITGILEYSRVGRLVEEEEEIDLNCLVTEIIEIIAPPDDMQIVIEPDLPTVTGDKIRIAQIFQNLLSNAVKFMDKPHGKITIGCVDEGDCWKFRVADNGPGIDKKNHEKIFQIFRTLEPFDVRESTGIGLTLVKKIIELHGGTIWIESELGQGSVFFFTLRKRI